MGREGNSQHDGVVPKPLPSTGKDIFFAIFLLHVDDKSTKTASRQVEEQVLVSGPTLTSAS
jgi:hypothetical protein